MMKVSLPAAAVNKRGERERTGDFRLGLMAASYPRITLSVNRPSSGLCSQNYPLESSVWALEFADGGERERNSSRVVLAGEKAFEPSTDAAAVIVGGGFDDDGGVCRRRHNRFRRFFQTQVADRFDNRFDVFAL